MKHSVKYIREPLFLLVFFLSPDASAPVIRGGSQIHASESDDHGGGRNPPPAPHPHHPPTIYLLQGTPRSWKEVHDGLRQKKSCFLNPPVVLNGQRLVPQPAGSKRYWKDQGVSAETAARVCGRQTLPSWGGGFRAGSGTTCCRPGRPQALAKRKKRRCLATTPPTVCTEHRQATSQLSLACLFKAAC